MRRITCLLLILIWPVALWAQSSAFLGHGYDFRDNGKDPAAPLLDKLYTLCPVVSGETAGGEVVSGEMVMAAASGSSVESLQVVLSGQVAYLKLQDPGQIHRLGGWEIQNGQLAETARRLIQKLESGRELEGFSLYRIRGEDSRGNVHFTGYYTPVVEARKQPDSVFRYPLYSAPASLGNDRPDRRQIDWGGSLAGRGLELAWTSDLLTNYFLHVQGSGYLHFPDGSLAFLSFVGHNGYAYTSIGKYLVERKYVSKEAISLNAIRQWFGHHPDSLRSVLSRNRSYTFFQFSETVPRGGSGTRLVAGHSIAVDTRYIPYGSVLLARVPVLNEAGRLTGHEYRILTAQDSGGAIKGPGHVDLYMGVGREAGAQAGPLHHYGGLWLILYDP